MKIFLGRKPAKYFSGFTKDSLIESLRDSIRESLVKPGKYFAGFLLRKIFIEKKIPRKIKNIYVDVK